MKQIALMKNTVQEYAWGSHTAIPLLLGESGPSQTPQAELWMGAHPKAPSLVGTGNGWRALDEVIAKSPEETLGKKVADTFGGKLPFLFKVLAAAQPLSIQAHPTLEQAREGFARENREGIPLDAPHRNYRDDNHKPEIICALSPFWALNGFRKRDEMLSMLREIHPGEIAGEIDELAAHPGAAGLKRFFSAIMTMPKDRQQRAVAQTVAVARSRAGDDPVWRWIVELDKRYPGDIGVMSPVLLNLVEIGPGEAMLCKAGQLHAYLDGVGMELMANSDNVLRGGLTPKHVDVPELLKVLTFDESDVSLVRADDRGAYPSDAAEFRLSVIHVDGGKPYESTADHGVEIWMSISGTASIRGIDGGEQLDVPRGTSFFVPAAAPPYRIEGDAVLYRASVPG